MKVFKIHKDDITRIICDEEFELATGNKYPFLRKNSKKKDSCFALCPICDNPIQLFGLFKKEEDGIEPFGKHCRKSISELAEYIQNEVLNCPYYTGNKKNGNYKIQQSDKTNKLFKFYEKHADVIFRIFSIKTGILMTDNLMELAVCSWFANEKWRYYAANVATLPYLTFYSDQAINLFGRIIDINSELYSYLNSIKKKYKIEFEKRENSHYAQIKSEKNFFLKLKFAIQGYKCSEAGEQSFVLSIVDPSINGEGTIIKRIKLPVDELIVQECIEKNYRNQKVIDLVRKLIG